MAIVTIESVKDLHERWMTLTTTSGREIVGKAGYLRGLLSVAEAQFGEEPVLQGLKVRIASEDDALAEAILFRGVWVMDKLMQEMWRQP